MTNPRRLTAIGTVLCLLGVLSLALSARTQTVPAAVIATVDFPRALQGLEERGVLEAGLRGKLDELDRTVKDIAAKVEKLDASIQLLPNGAAKDAQIVERARLRADANYEAEWAKTRFEQMKGEVLRTLYNKINDAAARLARSRNITMVLATDEGITLSTLVREQDVNLFAERRKIVYAQDDLDITQDLITFMNNEYKANVQRAP